MNAPRAQVPRTGAQYLDAIAADGRQVFFDGELVEDVTTHPAFRGAAQSLARLFDVAADPANNALMNVPSPATGAPVWRCYDIPKTAADLASRRAMSTRWAEESFGLMGRTPDHVAGFLAGYAAKPSVFAEAGAHYAENVQRYHAYARDNHLYLSYAIVPPQIDRSKPAHKQSDPTLHAGVVAERDGGIVLKGAQQLGTGAVFSDAIYISCIHPLMPGDEAYAFAAAVPCNAPGLKIYPRRPYAAGVTSRFDYPLSSRFDEIDALIVLDDVFVPWENVFCYRNLQLCRDQWWRTPSHSYGNHQAQARYAVKLRFLLGLTKRLCEITGVDPMPPVQIMLGEMAAYATIVESMLQAQETQATTDSEGVVWPSKPALYSVMALQSEINPKLLNIARELAGGSIIMLPSTVRDFDNPAIAADLERYIASPGFPSRARTQMLKLVWDLIGTEFAGRHEQYEKFYGGASFLVKQNMARAYDFAGATRLVDKALALPDAD
ncbi:MAG TPA: 4-hydroxyphenylacetate 3-hydroxylase N-terminal domain-containing protein [Micropepsaceae bacterium]|nr:4-hydroxyphenylacetate 3-hydroxylase N-terminal domain-containing protein [Micropepsaceae bacterium]